MSDFTVVKEGTWLYDGNVPTGVRIVSCPVRYGTGDWQDPLDIREDLAEPGFDVQWASATTPRDYGNFASAVFSSLQEAVAYVETSAWAASTLKWDEL